MEERLVMRGGHWGRRTEDARALSQVELSCHEFADGRERCYDVARCATGAAGGYLGLFADSVVVAEPVGALPPAKL